MMLLEKVARDDQKARWLQPIVDGEVRSSFAMTEPMPGGGSDPSAIRTRATRQGDGWAIHGHKWFITGGAAAEHFILIARTRSEEHTSELQSLMRISYAVFCLKKKNTTKSESK